MKTTEKQDRQYETMRNLGWDFYRCDGEKVIMRYNNSSVVGFFSWTYKTISPDGKLEEGQEK